MKLQYLLEQNGVHKHQIKVENVGKGISMKSVMDEDDELQLFIPGPKLNPFMLNLKQNFFLF